jgi:hypothetical protein
MPEQVAIHGKEAMVITSAQFHGRQLVDGSLESCKQCHSSNFSGGTAMLSCSSGDCHPNIAVHQSGINNPTSTNFHGKYISNYNVSMNTCNQCHGENFSGGIVSPACANCHEGITVHKDGVVNPASTNFHGKFIAADNWDMTACKSCHGNNYAGGVASPTCNSCHKNSGGPEACNTCHGDFSNLQNIAPPQALNNGATTDVPGVGAHTIHLTNVKIAQNVQCAECHSVPNNLASQGHIDNTPRAELKFGTFTSSGIGTPSYSYSTYKCNNTYCHGSFEFLKSNSNYPFIYTADKMVGNNYNPVWNKVDGSEATCGTCHGLPPTGHENHPLNACGTCHPGVVDNRGNIIDKTKHINGKIDVFGN